MQGVFFMCRRDQLLGKLLLAFGLGLLLGTWIGSDFWCCCFGIIAGVLGWMALKRK